MADEHLLARVHSLSDLELAFLLSLIAREHCQIRTSAAAIPDLVTELRLIATDVFRLQPAVISCTPQTTLDDFASALLLPHPSSPAGTSPAATFRPPSPIATRSPRQRHQHNHSHNHDGPSSYFQPTSAGPSSATNPTIAPVILAANLDLAPQAVQIQALELLRTRRVFTRTSVHTAPRTFLLVAVVADDRPGGGIRLNKWLNDWFYLAHAHSADDGYPNLDREYSGGEEGHAGLGLRESPEHGVDDSSHARAEKPSGTNPYHDSDTASTRSSSSVVVVKPHSLRLPSFGALSRQTATTSTTTRDGKLPAAAATQQQHPPADPVEEPVIAEADISHLAQLSQQVRVDVDVARYQMNVVSFLRMHRAVGGGVGPTATKHLELLSRSLAPLHGLDYVTPSLVQLAARKVYLHRIDMVDPERERSMQWGSELAAVEAVLQGVCPEDVIEDVLGMVTVPL